LDTVVLLVVASQMMRGQAPKYFFLEPPLVNYPSQVHRANKGRGRAIRFTKYLEM